jgi:lipid-A-disaccharide synthase
MPEPLRLFILAGEASGDRIGADLVRNLTSRVEVELAGVGGTRLAAAGLKSLFPMDELSVMGWSDVLPRLPRLLWRAGQVAAHIARTRPDIAVFVDAQVFSAIAARGVRRRGGLMPLVLYVAPAVWAWKPERAARLRGLFDEVLAVLPFEPEVMRKLGGPPTTFVGHPALIDTKERKAAPQRGPLLLLPGSREGELRRHLPLMRDVAAAFEHHPSIDGLVLPTPPATHRRVALETATWATPVTVVSDEKGKGDAFGKAVAAVAVTGTVTLELALAAVPMVTTYVADKGQARRWQRYGVRYAALPNILLDRQLVPEILGTEPQPSRVRDALDSLLSGGASDQLIGFGEVRRLIRDGAPGGPPVDAAARVLELARTQRSAIAT